MQNAVNKAVPCVERSLSFFAWLVILLNSMCQVLTDTFYPLSQSKWYQRRLGPFSAAHYIRTMKEPLAGIALGLLKRSSGAIIVHILLTALSLVPVTMSGTL